jgi:hypothetical protein
MKFSETASIAHRRRTYGGYTDEREFMCPPHSLTSQPDPQDQRASPIQSPP